MADISNTEEEVIRLKSRIAELEKNLGSWRDACEACTKRNIDLATELARLQRKSSS